MKKLFVHLSVLLILFGCSEKESQLDPVKNTLSVNGKEYSISQVVIKEWKTSRDPAYNSVDSRHISFMSASFQFDAAKSRFIGTGQFIDFEVNSSEEDRISNGIYSLSSNLGNKDFEVRYTHYSTLFNATLNNNEFYSDGESYEVLSGKLEVTINQDSGTVEFEGIDENGFEIKGYYSGIIPTYTMYEFND